MFEWVKKIVGDKPPKTSPFKEAGTSGTAIYGGYVITNERNPKLVGTERYRTAADIMTNTSIVAAGLRYFLNLVAKPRWIVEPADDTPAAKEYAEFVESVMYGMNSSWARMVRRAGMYKFHGFSVQEWTAKRREDGMIGFADIESRPQFTIERWEPDDNGTITGMWQRSPQTGVELWLPRDKVIYIVDDMLTDSPEGMGWFRQLAEPADRLNAYLKQEVIGFERDLSGIPIGRAPITAINRAVKAGTMSQAQADTMIAGIKRFVQLEVKKENTGMVLDSQTFENQTSDGAQASGVAQWGIELLTGSAGSMPQLGEAIQRLNVEMARIMGIENILIGSDGTGSLALSRDKSNNLYLQVNATNSDMAEAFDRDVIGPLWKLNGFPKEMRPTFKTEDVAFRDVEQVTAALRDMATAGAPVMPDDEAINAVRDMLGLPHQEQTLI